MRIAVNTRFLLKGKLEGIGWFTHQIMQHMALAHPEHEFIFIFDRAFHPDFVFAKNVTPVVVSPPARHPFLWYIWFEWAVPRVLKKYKADIFLSTDGFASLRTKVPQCLVVHDLSFVHYPKYISRIHSWYLRKYTPLFAKKAKHVIAVSEYTKQDIHAQYNTPLEKISVVYNAAHECYQPLSAAQKQSIKEKYTGGVDYFIYAGSLHPRKNIVKLLKAFAQFKKHTRSNIKLILVGRLAWLTQEIEETLAQHPHKHDIIRIDYLEAQELSQVLGAAYALVYVSVFEGFGIPILEAINCHVPVIASNITSMPEVGGNASCLIDPFNTGDICKGMLQVYNDENYRNKLISACAEQSAKFSWAKSAEQLHNILIGLQ